MYNLCACLIRNACFLNCWKTTGTTLMRGLTLLSMARYTELRQWNHFRYLSIFENFFSPRLLLFLWQSYAWCKSNKGGVEAWQELSSESLMHRCQVWLYLDRLKGYSNSCHCHKIPRHCHTKEDAKNGKTLMLLCCSEMLSSPGFMPAISSFFLSVLAASNIWDWYFVAQADQRVCRCSANRCLLHVKDMHSCT